MRRTIAFVLLTVSACSAATWHGFSVREVWLDGESWTVAVADTAAERQRGLSGIDTMDGVDGMLFEFPTDTTARFWMRDTFFDLDIAFFDGDGDLVEVLTMPSCRSDPCPTYAPDVPYRRALEASAGSLQGLSVGVTTLEP